MKKNEITKITPDTLSFIDTDCEDCFLSIRESNGKSFLVFVNAHDEPIILDQTMLKELLPYLTKFAETGKLT